jgi:hypothetical protein
MQFIVRAGQKALTTKGTKQRLEPRGDCLPLRPAGLRSGCGGEAVRYAAGPEAGVAVSDDVDGGVADHQSLVRPGFGLAQDGVCASGIGLLGGFKSIAPIM